MAFLQNFVSQQLLFLFSKHLDTMSIRQIVSPVKQIFALVYFFFTRKWTSFSNHFVEVAWKHFIKATCIFFIICANIPWWYWKKFEESFVIILWNTFASLFSWSETFNLILQHAFHEWLVFGVMFAIPSWFQFVPKKFFQIGSNGNTSIRRNFKWYHSSQVIRK